MSGSADSETTFGSGGPLSLGWMISSSSPGRFALAMSAFPNGVPIRLGRLPLKSLLLSADSDIPTKSRSIGAG